VTAENVRRQFPTPPSPDSTFRSPGPVPDAHPARPRQPFWSELSLCPRTRTYSVTRPSCIPQTRRVYQSPRRIFRPVPTLARLPACPRRTGPSASDGSQTNAVISEMRRSAQGRRRRKRTLERRFVIGGYASVLCCGWDGLPSPLCLVSSASTPLLSQIRGYHPRFRMGPFLCPVGQRSHPGPVLPVLGLPISTGGSDPTSGHTWAESV
jgi:hypothetical protein